MDEESPAEIQQWLRDQVQDYGELYPRFKRYAELLQEVLQAAAGAG